MNINTDNFYLVFEEITCKEHGVTNCQMLSLMLDELAMLRTENKNLKERLEDESNN